MYPDVIAERKKDLKMQILTWTLPVFWCLLSYPTINGQEGETNCKESFLCTESYCDSVCAPNDCYIPNGPDCVGEYLPLYDNSNDYCACCNRRCVSYLEEGSICSNSPITPYPTEMCGPQLSCQQDTFGFYRCLPSKTTCVQALVQYETDLENGELGMNVSPPLCDDLGQFQMLQCYRGGLCRCVDKETGDPIFGITGSETQARETSQNCECATNYYESLKQACRMSLSYLGEHKNENYVDEYNACLEKALKSSATDNVFFPSHMRCLPNGNFDPIQCVTNYLFPDDDRCFCINENIDQNGTITFRSQITDLHCYNTNIHLPEYFNPCEAEVKSLKDEMSLYEEDVLTYDGNSAPICDPDGFYSKIQHDNLNYTRMFCSDKYGNQIEQFEADITTNLGQLMNCECALARKYLATGVPKPTCCSNGNYRQYQCQAGQCYCVDKFGRQQGQEKDQLDISELNCEYTCGDE